MNLRRNKKKRKKRVAGNRGGDCSSWMVMQLDRVIQGSPGV